MADGTETPPGLEALANHLGYAFVKKDSSTDTSSNSGSIDDMTQSGSGSVPKANKETKGKDGNDTEKPKIPKGSLNSFGNIYYNSDDQTWTSEEPKNTEPAENEDTAGHAVLIRRKKSKDSRKKYHIDSLIIQSPELKVALGEILDDYPDVCCNLDRLVFDEPFEPFVHRWGALLEYMKRDNLEGATKDHLILLHGILSKELGDTIKAFDDYVSNGVVTYEHAWIVFQPGAVIMASGGPGHDVALKLQSGSYVSTPDEGNMYRMHCERVDWNGKSFGWASEYVQLKEFKGIRPINKLSAFPLAFHPKKETVKIALIERGKNWAELAGTHYRRYKHPIPI
jgi:hypothetical protein